MKLTDQEKSDIIKLTNHGYSSRFIADTVLGRASRKSTVTDFLSTQSFDNIIEVIDEDPVYKGPKILFLDIETAPLMAHLWSIWQHGVGLNQVQKDWYILSFTAKWAHEADSELHYYDQRDAASIEDDSALLAPLWDLLDQADFVVGHNIRKFDMKKINARFLINGFGRPSTYRQIDTLEIAKNNFGFTSNKLEYLTDKLCTKYKKSKHKKFAGHELWNQCLKNNPEAWDEMEEYNKLDVLSNQELYEIFLPWNMKLPNFDLYFDDETPDLSDWMENGFHYTNLGKYQRYLNVETGQQRRSRTNLLPKEFRTNVLANIL